MTIWQREVVSVDDDVQLIEPDGTLGLIVSRPTAIAFCNSHPGWSWRDVEHEQVPWDDSE